MLFTEKLYLYLVSKKVYAFGGPWNQKNVTDIQNYNVIYQSKAKLDEKSLFGKITCL